MREMNDSDPKLIALLYNECINNQDLNGLILMMSEDHKFIDIKNRVETKEQMKESWRSFFEQYPDYKNVFHTIISRDNFVIMLGHSECSHEPLDGPAIWTAKIVNGKVAEWRIYDDNEDNRVLLLITK
jgi:ketosteroid isomerase-like protein